MTDTFDISKLKPLNLDQYDAARRKTLTRVQARIGDRPTRADFHRELGSIFTLLDVLAIGVFVPALIVSSIHIILHMGALANDSYSRIATYSAGSVIGRDLYTAVHQWALIPLAEASMLLFLVMFALSPRTWRKYVFLALSAAAVAFILVANVQSAIGTLESVLAPILTIGVGLHIEGLIVRQLERRNDVNTRYLAALATWEAASKDATKHPDYAPLLRQEIWARLMNLSSNKQFADAPVAFKHAAVRREMERDTWAYDSGETPQRAPAPTAYQNGAQPESEGEAQPEAPLSNSPSIRIVHRPGDGDERA